MKKVFTVFDSKVGAYMPPFYAQSRGEAIRMFTDSVNDNNSSLAKHPEDYVLFALGDYDEQTAGFALLPAPESLGVAVEFIRGGVAL